MDLKRESAWLIFSTAFPAFVIIPFKAFFPI